MAPGNKQQNGRTDTTENVNGQFDTVGDFQSGILHPSCSASVSPRAG